MLTMARKKTGRTIPMRRKGEGRAGEFEVRQRHLRLEAEASKAQMGNGWLVSILWRSTP
jgi:hypothetical protein